MTFLKRSILAFILVSAFGIAPHAYAQQMDCAVSKPYTAIKHGSWDMNVELQMQTIWLGTWDADGNWVLNYNAYTKPDSPFTGVIGYGWGAGTQSIDPPFYWFDPAYLYYGPHYETTGPECSEVCETIPGADFCLYSGMGFCNALEYKTGINPASFTYIPSPPAYSHGSGWTTTYGGYAVSTCVPVPLKANMVTSIVTPATADAGIATSFSATVTNNGVGNAGATQTRFQRATSAAGANVTNLGDVLTSAANVGVSRVATGSYTLTAGTWYLRACADATALVDESSENDNCGAWRPVTVAEVVIPVANLTAGSVTPVIATEDVAHTFSANVVNSGTAATTGSSYTRFQRATSAAGAGATNIGDVLTGAVNTGVSVARTVSYTFTTAGTFYMRACANATQTANESNFNDNCGPWTAITVAAATPPSVSCTVSPSSITTGQSVTYRANPAGGASTPFTWIASDGASVGTAATVTRTLTAPGTYAMNVRASGTSVSYCPNVSVTANWCTAGSSNLSITATPERTRNGQSVSLSWSASNVSGQGTVCTVTGPGVSWSSAVTVSPSCSASGSATPTITTQSTYTLTCGADSKSVTVNVIPNFEEF